MPGTTPLYALPYPLAGDAVSDLDDRFRALTTRLEIVLAAASQPPLTPSDFAALSAQITAFGAAPVSVASPIAAAAGFGTTAVMWSWQRMRFAVVTIVNNTGAAIAMGTTGLVTGTPTVGTIAATHRPNATVTGAVSSSSVLTAARLASTGIVSLSNGVASQSWAAASSVTVPFVYLAA